MTNHRQGPSAGYPQGRLPALSKDNEIFTNLGPIERVPIDAISPPPRSLRKHTDRHKKQYARCIEALGLVSPIVIDSAGVIVAGLLWYFGALFLGLRELPVIRLTHLTPEQLEVYRIAEQRLAELAPWDERAYATELEPRYVDVAIRRWQRHTGREAVHHETGRSFDEITAERGLRK